MVDTIKVSELPLETSPTSDDIVPVVDITTSSTKKVSFEEFGKAIDYSNSISTDTDNLLAVDASKKLLLRADEELISADANNTITVGTDGKLKGSATSLALSENEFFIGNASNVPVSTSAKDTRTALGLPIDYIKDDISYVSANQVSWSGSCRDSSDSRDFVLGSAATASLVSAAINTTYNLFVASNTLTDTPVVVWSDSSAPAGYTYYRMVLVIVTDGIGNIINFENIVNGNKDITITFKSDVTYLPTGDITLPVPENSFFDAAYFVLRDAATGSSFVTVKDLNNNKEYTLRSVNFVTTALNISRLIKTNSLKQVSLVLSGGAITGQCLFVAGYPIER